MKETWDKAMHIEANGLDLFALRSFEGGKPGKLVYFQFPVLKLVSAFRGK